MVVVGKRIGFCDISRGMRRVRDSERNDLEVVGDNVYHLRNNSDVVSSISTPFVT